MNTLRKHIETLSISKLVVAFLGAALFGLTTACNTVEGFGHDVEHAGDAIEDTAH